MVTLSATTVESEDYAVGGSEWWQEVCGMQVKPARVLLTKDLSDITHVEAYQDGANVDAWIDQDGDVFVLIDDGNDVCQLESEEFELLKGGEGDSDSDDGETPAEEATTGADEPPAYVDVTLYGNADDAYKLEIAEASADVATCAVAWAKAQEAAKGAKKAFEGAVEELRSIIGRGPEVLPLFDQRPAKQQPGGDFDATNSTADDPADADTRDRWRAIPIEDVCFGIKGLGAKKLEALRETVPTLGAFEDLRAKASLAGCPLREYMPKGIGQDACDQLEESALNRM
jgi:hypothetical protein